MIAVESAPSGRGRAGRFASPPALPTSFLSLMSLLIKSLQAAPEGESISLHHKHCPESMAAGVDGALEGSGAVGSQPESVLSWQDAGALGSRVSLRCAGSDLSKSRGGRQCLGPLPPGVHGQLL